MVAAHGRPAKRCQSRLRTHNQKITDASRPVVRGEIEARELNQGQVADLVGVGRRTINEICRERKPMSTDMAHRSGKLFGNGPTLWVNMQKAVDLWAAEREHSTDYAKTRTLEITR